MVGTNSISQNRGRSASLNYIVARGGVITDAVSSQDWPGEANVHVSIVNWINEVVGGYRFHLRVYGHQGYDTVLYAVPT